MANLIKVRHIKSPVGIGDWPHRVARVDSIDLKSVASTLLYTVPTGFSFYITGVAVRVTAANSISAAATAGVGKTNSTFEFFPATAMTNLHSLNQVYLFLPAGTLAIASAGETVRFNVTVAATGTSQVASVDLIGILFN